MRPSTLLCTTGFLFCGALPAVAADKRVCVEVELKQSDVASQLAPPADGQAEGQKTDWSSLPVGENPFSYFKRLIEHFVTHEPGFVAAGDGCEETLRVELYPLGSGWTAFARYSGTGREERVDRLYPDEMSRFSERAVLALLHDTPISDTINRENVLRADSYRSEQRVKGSNHVTLGVGTQLRGGYLKTAQDDRKAPAEKEIRLFSPMTLMGGWRGKFENWGVDAGALLAVGTSKSAARFNEQGGHVDFSGGGGLGLHFLHYLNPRGMTSTYVGAGGTFEMLRFTIIKDQSAKLADIKENEYYNYYNGANDKDLRSALWTGGLDIDVIGGYEFMRASSVQFLLQAELNLPAYVIQSENEDGGIHSWFPGVSVKLGVLF